MAPTKEQLAQILAAEKAQEEILNADQDKLDAFLGRNDPTEPEPQQDKSKLDAFLGRTPAKPPTPAPTKTPEAVMTVGQPEVIKTFHTSSNDPIGAFLRSYNQGATAHFGDEVSSGTAEALSGLEDLYKKVGLAKTEEADSIPRTYAAGSRYADMRDNMRADLTQDKYNYKDAPWYADPTVTGELAGGATLALATQGRSAAAAAPTAAARVSGFGPRLAQYATEAVPRLEALATTGAKWGAAVGYGNSEAEDLSGQLEDTVVGGGTGALVSPVFGEAFHVAGKIPVGGLRWLAKKMYPQMDPERAEVIYGKELAEQARKMADPNSTAGRDLRSLSLAGADDAAIDAHTQGVTRRAQDILSTREALEARTDVPLKNLAKLGNDPRRVAEHTEDISRNVNKLVEHGDVVKWHEDIEAKRGPVRALIGAEDKDPQVLINHADATANRMRMAVEEMAQTTEKGTPEQTVINKLRSRLNEYDKAAQLHQDADLDTAADRWMQLDQLKRQLQIHMDRAKSIPGSGIAYEFEPVEHQLRSQFEDPEIWGHGPAAYQKLRNRGWVERLNLEGRDAPPSRVFLSDASTGVRVDEDGNTVRSLDPFRGLPIGDTGKIQPLVQDAGSLGTRTKETVLREWAKREPDLLDALSSHVDADPNLLERSAFARRNGNSIIDSLDARTAEREAAETMAGRVKAQDASLAQARSAFMTKQFGDPTADAIDPAKVNGIIKGAGLTDMAVNENALREWAGSPEITATLNQRAQEAGASRTFDQIRAAESNTPRLQPGKWSRGLELLPKGQEIKRLFSAPDALSQEALQLQQLERAVAEDPQNVYAKMKLQALRERGTSPLAAKLEAFGGAARPTVEAGIHTLTRNRSADPDSMFATPAKAVVQDFKANRDRFFSSVDENREQAAKDGKGQNLSMVVTDVLQRTPQVLGKFQGEFAKAYSSKEPNAVAALLARLSQDREFRSTVLPKLQAASGQR